MAPHHQHDQRARDPAGHVPAGAPDEQGRDREPEERHEHHGGFDRLPAGVAARSVEAEPVVAELLDRGGAGQSLDQQDGRMPLGLADHEADEVRGEQDQADAEREGPHQAHSVRLHEDLLERRDAVAHEADGRIDRGGHDLVGAVGVAGEGEGERDVAGRRQPAVELEGEDLSLLDDQQRGG